MAAIARPTGTGAVVRARLSTTPQTSVTHGTIEGIKTAPSEGATSRRDLAKSPPISAKTREVSMASPHVIRNHTFAESVVSLPPGEWRLIRGVRRFVRSTPPTSTKVVGYQGRPAACGTPSGYNRHRNADEDVCIDCRRAIRDRTRARRAKAAEAAA
jgi:hypothetical protein